MDILHLYISAGHSFVGRHGQTAAVAPIVEPDAVECVAGMGIVGDRYFGYKEDYKGQITFFAMESHERICRELGMERPPSVYRRNVITRGVDLNTLVGKEFELQGVWFEGTEESRPCYWMNQAFGPGAEEAMKGCGGLRARILTDGRLVRSSRKA